jgi:hypothetical protein
MECCAHNGLVPGSSPGRPTIAGMYITNSAVLDDPPSHSYFCSDTSGVVLACFPRRIERQGIAGHELNSPFTCHGLPRNKPEYRTVAVNAKRSHPDISARTVAQRVEVPFHGVADAPVRVRTSCSYQFYGVVNEAAARIEKKRANKVSRNARSIIELTVHKEQAPVAQTTDVVYVPGIGNQPDLLG